MLYLSIKNYERYQHYKDRSPPWIKLHASTLDDHAFACLQDASKAHLMLLWLLASKLDNRIPWDDSWLAKKLMATSSVDIQVLVDAGFIVVEHDASRLLAERKQDAMPETEGETETERPIISAGIVSIVGDARRNGHSRSAKQTALDELAEKLAPASRVRFRAACAGYLDGMDLGAGLRATPADVELAATDWLTNNSGAKLTAIAFRGYVEKNIKRRRAAEAEQSDQPTTPGFTRHNGKMSGAERGYLDAKRVAEAMSK